MPLNFWKLQFYFSWIQTHFVQLSPLDKFGMDSNTPPNSTLMLSAYVARDVSPGSSQIQFCMALWSSFWCTGFQKLYSLQNWAFSFFLSNILIPLRSFGILFLHLLAFIIQHLVTSQYIWKTLFAFFKQLMNHDTGRRWGIIGNYKCNYKLLSLNWNPAPIWEIIGTQIKMHPNE